MAIWKEEKIYAVDEEARTISIQSNLMGLIHIRSESAGHTVCVCLRTDEAITFLTHALKAVKAWPPEIK